MFHANAKNPFLNDYQIGCCNSRALPGLASPRSFEDQNSGVNPFFCSSFQHLWHASRPSAHGCRGLLCLTR